MNHKLHGLVLAIAISMSGCGGDAETAQTPTAAPQQPTEIQAVEVAPVEI
jgi:PBP1b-binding outer membrane lipoprotein LpoB